MENTSVKIDDIAYHSLHRVQNIDELGWSAPAGYAFKCWNTQANGYGQSYSPGDSIRMEDSDINLYAIWRLNDYNISYRNYVTNADESFPDGAGQWRTYNDSSPLPYCPPPPSPMSDYIFDFWTPSEISPGETGDKTFMSHWIPNSSSTYGMIVVPVVDISGSMSGSSFHMPHAATAISSIICDHILSSEYLTSVNIKMFIGDYPNNISTAYIDQNFNKEEYTNEHAVWNKVYPLIWNKRGTNSESMLTCLYFAINSIMNSITPRTRVEQGTSAIAFSVMSDEYLFNDTALNMYTETHDNVTYNIPWKINITGTDKKTIACRQAYDENWFPKWQTNTNNKFPLFKYTSTEYGGRHTGNPSSKWAVTDFVIRMNKSLQDMSYYYGINFTFCFVSDDIDVDDDPNTGSAVSSKAKNLHELYVQTNAPDQNKQNICKKYLPYATLALAKYSDGSSLSTWSSWLISGFNPSVENDKYNPNYGTVGIDKTDNNKGTCIGMYRVMQDLVVMPTNADNYVYPVSDLSDPMCRVIIFGTITIDNSRIMQDNDLYTENKYNKFHAFDISGSGSGPFQYVAYKYFDYTDYDYTIYNGTGSQNAQITARTENNHNKIKLPSQDEIENVPLGKSLDRWEVVQPSGNIEIPKSGNEYWYTPIRDHIYPDVPYTVYVKPVFS